MFLKILNFFKKIISFKWLSLAFVFIPFIFKFRRREGNLKKYIKSSEKIKKLRDNETLENKVKRYNKKRK